MRPILFAHCDRLLLQYSRRLFTGFGAFDNDFARHHLSVAQLDAMDTLEFVARKHSISMTLQKGDIQFVNNLGVLHARASFTDDQTNQ
jgi:alpha-ketoglutarate-dependent taurine dioxygenase